MERSFGAIVDEWQDFHTFLGSAAFTLLGLLFIALSLRLNIFRRRELADVRDFALLTFANFLTLTLIALLFLIPSQSRAGVAIPLLVMGALGLVANLLLLRESRRVNTGAYALSVPQEVWYGLSALPYAGLVVVGMLLLLDRTRALYWLVGVEVGLLLISSFNAWALLARAQPESGPESPDAG